MWEGANASNKLLTLIKQLLILAHSTRVFWGAELFAVTVTMGSRTTVNQVNKLHERTIASQEAAHSALSVRMWLSEQYVQ